MHRSLIDEVESAIASGSPDKRVETLRRVTDLFLVRPDDYSDTQVDVFGDVISRLAERIETKARAELANRLAPVKNAPTTIVRALARDESIEVAGPVLAQSNRLTEEDLLACAKGNSQERFLAISKRASLSETLGDMLVMQGNKEVVRSIAKNEGARFSSAGFGELVQKSTDDVELAVSFGLRKDIPKEHFHALISKASEAVFQKLAASNPAAAREVNRVLLDITGVPKIKATYEYKEAKAHFDLAQRAGEPIDAIVRSFADSGKFEETVVALSVRCHLPVDAVENIMMDKRADNGMVLILAKSSGLSWQTAKLILQMRCGRAKLSPQATETARKDFERLQVASAQRVIRFYQVRHAAGEKQN